MKVLNISIEASFDCWQKILAQIRTQKQIRNYNWNILPDLEAFLCK